MGEYFLWSGSGSIEDDLPDDYWGAVNVLIAKDIGDWTLWFRRSGVVLVAAKTCVRGRWRLKFFRSDKQCQEDT